MRMAELIESRPNSEEIFLLHFSWSFVARAISGNVLVSAKLFIGGDTGELLAAAGCSKFETGAQWSGYGAWTISPDLVQTVSS